MNESFIEYLEKAFNENKISHAFLIETDNYDRILNEVFNFFLSKDLISNQSNINSNISVRCVTPCENVIDKDSILGIQEFVLTTSFCNKFKIYFIVEAGLMNLSAVNKLLKVLEEPSSDTIGFLLCSSYNSILPTIYSRCQLFIDKDNLCNFEVDSDIYNELLKFKLLSYEEFVLLKKKIISLEKSEIIEVFKVYLRKLYDDNDLFYLKISEFIENLRYNVNIDLYLDKLFLER